MKKHFISIIIPVFNEQRTIDSVLAVIRFWKKVGVEIIVVDDGSTDKTLDIITRCKSWITIIPLKKNQGKGAALAQGILAAQGDILLFLDGDLVGLTHKDLDQMLSPLVKAEADMVIGVARFWGIGSFQPYNDISGQRVVWRKNVLHLIEPMRNVGRGVEFLFNDAHPAARIARVRLPSLTILGKMQKESVTSALHSYLKEAGEFLTALTYIYSKRLSRYIQKDERNHR